MNLCTGITIDGPKSRDLDDAFWIERKGSGYHVSALGACR